MLSLPKVVGDLPCLMPSAMMSLVNDQGDRRKEAVPLDRFIGSSEQHLTGLSTWNPSKTILSLLKLFPGAEIPNFGYMFRWDRAYVWPEVISLRPKCWHYRGEGNANLVVAFDDEASIIRFSKNFNGTSWTDQQRKKIERQVVFANNIFTPLLGKNLVAKVRIVYVSPDQISLLNQSLRALRPSDRLHKEIVMPYATVHTDFARIQSLRSSPDDFCIEIKPKKGWWVPDGCNIAGRPNLCTYCLNQYLKIKKSKISTCSAYCPLDLFSGDAARIVKAVTALLRTPQNNFRIFKDGSLEFTETSRNDILHKLHRVLSDWIGYTNIETTQMGLFNNAVYLICLRLLYPQNDMSSNNFQHYLKLKSNIEAVLRNQTKLDPVSGSNYGKSCSSAFNELPRGCLLSVVLQAQKLEDAYDNDIIQAYRRICPLHKSSIGSSSCPSAECTTTEIWLDEVPVDHMSSKELATLQRHQIAATLKDCSLMLTFRPFHPTASQLSSTAFVGPILKDLYGGQHSSQVGIVDLDPKSLTSTVKTKLRQTKMVLAYYEQM